MLSDMVQRGLMSPRGHEDTDTIATLLTETLGYLTDELQEDAGTQEPEILTEADRLEASMGVGPITWSNHSRFLRLLPLLLEAMLQRPCRLLRDR